METDDDNEIDVTPAEQTEEAAFETTPEEATGFDKPGTFNRKKVLMALCISFAVVVCGGLLINTARGKKNTEADDSSAAAAARAPSGFLQTQMNRAASAQERELRENGSAEDDAFFEFPPEDDPLLPAASWNGGSAAALTQPSQVPPPPASAGGAQTPRSNTAPQVPSYLISPLTPRLEGTVFQYAPSGAAAAAQPQGRNAADEYLQFLQSAPGMNTPSYPGMPVDPYLAQNMQDNRQAFYDGGGTQGDGYFTAANALWIGTIIPGILITGINTDLPGTIIARVTENIYDSRTGRNLLIPQGTILQARYNSAVSYAQKRVQIAWDTLIRPDGYLLDLGGMAGVDQRGMSGQEAQYNENWFEYLKAAGIIALFTVANAKMIEDAGRFSNNDVAGSIAEANAGFIGEIGNNVVSRAMNIQPTLTVDSGTVVNILLNRNLYLPSLDPYPAERKYILE